MKLCSYNLVNVAVAACLVLSAPAVHAGLILNYDSVLPSSGGSDSKLTRIDSQTDKSLVSSSKQFSRLGTDVSNGIVRYQQPSFVAGEFADQADINFRFGASPVNPQENYEIPDRAVSDSLRDGNYIQFGYTAAQDQELYECKFHMYVNSVDKKIHAARDAAVFIDVGKKGFKQFGNIHDGRNGNNWLVSFSDSLSVSKGETVVIRLVFADKKKAAAIVQTATRVGNVQIFSRKDNYTGIPEPTAFAMILGFASMAFVAHRRRR